MADLDQTQTDAGTGTDAGTAEATHTPLDAILDTSATDAGAKEQEGEAGLGGVGDPQVPLKALRKERERRQKSDRQVEELEREIRKFNDAKWGIPDEFNDPPAEQQPAGDDTSQDPRTQNYYRSLTNFTKKHSDDGVYDKVNAALDRVHRENGEHYQRVLYLVGNHSDPVTAIHAYFDQLGLLDFKGQPIGDVLASKDKQAQPDTSHLDQRLAYLGQREQAIANTARRTEYLASKTDFVAEHGKAAYDEVDRQATAFVESDPRGAEFRHLVAVSPDPVGLAAYLLTELGYRPQQAPRQQASQPQMAFPSNLANRRNVGQRRGPAYSGPTPLADIFRH